MCGPMSLCVDVHFVSYAYHFQSELYADRLSVLGAVFQQVFFALFGRWLASSLSWLASFAGLRLQVLLKREGQPGTSGQFWITDRQTQAMLGFRPSN